MTDYPIIPADVEKREVCKCGHPKERHSPDCLEPLNPDDFLQGYCQCQTYEYSPYGELDWLRKQHTEMLKFMDAIDNCFKWCECDGGGHNEGPYFVECPTCLGHGMRVTDFRSLHTLHYTAASILKTRWYHPDFRPFEDEYDND
jgi:hypothetical protein